jgi:hypothetical protein
MSMVQHVFAFLGQVLLLAVLVSVLFGRFVHEVRKRRIVVLVLLALGLFVPVHGLSISQWLRSALGELSLLTWLVFANILAQRLFDFSLLQPASRNSLLLGVILVSVVFYPMALGVSQADPYYYGYAPTGMALLLCMVSLLAWIKSRRDLAIILLLPLLGFNVHLLESANLWDYLLDPVLCIYAVVQSLLNLKFFFLNRGRKLP